MTVKQALTEFCEIPPHPAISPLVHLQTELGFSGGVLLWLENGKVTQQMQIPGDYFIGDLKALIETGVRAKLITPPSATGASLTKRT